MRGWRIEGEAHRGRRQKRERGEDGRASEQRAARAREAGGHVNDGGGSEWTARLTTALRSSRRVRRRLLERRRAERTTAPERVWRCRAGLMLEADCVHDHARPRPEWTWTTCGVDSKLHPSLCMPIALPRARERPCATKLCSCDVLRSCVQMRLWTGLGAACQNMHRHADTSRDT